jgi:hypothetical protein
MTRPLHAIASYENIDIDKLIIELLLARDAHTDCIDDLWKLPQDLTYEPTVNELLS